MKTRTLSAIAAFALASTALAGAAYARDQIRIVGSSTVYPFTTAVAEQFGKAGTFKTPVVESTGTGGGFKLFCAGVGEATPDVTNASRAIKKSEFETCAKNGVTDIVELKIGFDGIVIAKSKEGSRPQADPHPALPGARQGQSRVRTASWSPTPTRCGATSTRRCRPRRSRCSARRRPPARATPSSSWSWTGRPQDRVARRAPQGRLPRPIDAVWKSIREDGAYIDAGENDNLIVQKLEANPNAVGIFGYSFLEENASQDPGRRDRRRRPDLRDDRRRHLQGRPSALRLLQEAACRRRSRACRSSSTSTPPTRRWATTAISPPRASFRFPPTIRAKQRRGRQGARDHLCARPRRV